jgi:hypothetical protein
MQYRCAHCLAVLGDYVEGESEPKCNDHPEGSVQLIPEDIKE